MKRIQALIISLLFLITNNIQASFLQGPNPYSFGPHGRSVSDLREFAKPKNMMRILPNRPVAATDSSGNRVYYTPDGKMTLTIAKDGSMSFSLGGVSKNYNSDGEFSGSTKTLKGSGLLQEVRNKDNKIIGFKALNGDGKVDRTYDKDMNLTAKYVYKGQGAKLDYVQNNMTKGRTYFDDYGREMVEKDVDGFILATYQYQDVAYEYGDDEKTVVKKETKGDKGSGLLLSKKSYQKDLKREGCYATTYFDLEGKITYVKDAAGLITEEYHYKQDDKGNKILDYVLNNDTKEKTFFDEHGNRDYTLNDLEFVVARYFDDYSIHIAPDGGYTVTRYDIDGKELYTTFQKVEYKEDGSIDVVKDVNDEISEEYFYREGKNGDKIIDYIVNHNDKDYGTTYTWYDEDGKPICTTRTKERPNLNDEDKEGKIIRDFHWNGDTLVYTFDRKTGMTNYYNMDKELVYVAFNDRIVNKNIYSRGQLIGKWDAQNENLLVYINERTWLTFEGYSKEPSEQEISYIITNSTIVEIAKEQQKVAGGVKDGEDSISQLNSLNDAWLKDVLENPN